MGGVHPTVLPEEAIRHSDAVVIGEAEDTWSTLLSDFEHGKLQKFYKSSQPDDTLPASEPRTYAEIKLYSM
jgi:radical SAM superfamily enzyme YgiQ (UPF0313 family)